MRRTIRITHNPDKAQQNKTIVVRYPDFRKDDVIVPGSSKLSFKIDLVSEGGNTDTKRTIVNNLGRAILSKIDIRLEGESIFTLNNADIIYSLLSRFVENNERKKKYRVSRHPK